jgi:hypothetical protein
LMRRLRLLLQRSLWRNIQVAQHKVTKFVQEWSTANVVHGPVIGLFPPVRFEQTMIGQGTDPGQTRLGTNQRRRAGGKSRFD